MTDNRDTHPVALCRSLVDAGLDSGTAGLAAVLAVHFPPELAIYAAAGLPSLLKVTVVEGARRIGRLVHKVADEGHDFDALVAECEADDEKAQLAIRTIEAARTANTEEQFRALASSFVHGATTADRDAVNLDTAIVRAVGALDRAHVTVLRLFFQSEHDLFGVTFRHTGEPVDRSPQSLMRLHIVQQMVKQPDGTEPPEEATAGVNSVVDGLIGELAARGLIAEVPGQVSAGSRTAYALTPFGVAVADRLTLVAEAEEGEPSAP